MKPRPKFLPDAICINPALNFVKAIIVTLLVMLLSKAVNAQSNASLNGSPTAQTNVTAPLQVLPVQVSGRVVDDVDEPLPGCSVILKGTSYGTTADADGKFSFPRDLQNGDILIFSFIGFESQEYVVTAAASDLVIKMKIQNLLGEVAVDCVYESQPASRSVWSKIKAIF